jgi:molybdopterin synthase catalytic subunit
MSRDLVAIRKNHLDVDEAVGFVRSGEAGGIDVFIGATRAEKHPEHGALVALEYEAYEEMAVKEITRMVHEAREKWGVIRAAVLHRTGRVAVGEPSVIIAVSCPHRGEAFEACRYLIEQLKKSAPIWKKDVFAGAATWKHET